MNMQLQVLPDNDTSVIRGPVIKKTGWPRGQWSGANPTPECFPFSGVPGANYLAGVIRGVARFISVYEGEYSWEAGAAAGKDTPENHHAAGSERSERKPQRIADNQ